MDETDKKGLIGLDKSRNTEYKERIREISPRLKLIAEEVVKRTLPQNYRNLKLVGESGIFDSSKQYVEFISEIKDFYEFRRTRCSTFRLNLRFKPKTLGEVARIIANDPEYRSEEQIYQEHQKEGEDLAKEIFDEAGVF